MSYFSIFFGAAIIQHCCIHVLSCTHVDVPQVCAGILIPYRSLAFLLAKPSRMMCSLHKKTACSPLLWSPRLKAVHAASPHPLTPGACWNQTPDLVGKMVENGWTWLTPPHPPFKIVIRPLELPVSCWMFKLQTRPQEANKWPGEGDKGNQWPPFFGPKHSLGLSRVYIVYTISSTSALHTRSQTWVKHQLVWRENCII